MMLHVECPHCGAQGELGIPPIGAIIIGPCPQCQEFVVVFCGAVLPLDKEIMSSEIKKDTREHLTDIITEFIAKRIAELMPIEGISDKEVDRFKEVDLELLDNTAYFKSIFGEDDGKSQV